MSLTYLQRWRTAVTQSSWLATWPAWLAAYFIVMMLLDRLSGLHVGSGHALLAGTALAVLMFRQQPKTIALFFLVLLSAIAWMSFRDVLHGAGWKASERTVKAAILTLGMLACCRLPPSLWKLTLAAVVPCGIVILTAYIGPEQFVRALLSPLDFAAVGLVTKMNRNGLALPLGLLTCWAVVAVFQLRPRWLWLLPAAALTVLMIANGSRNAIAALVVAVLIMLFWRFSGRALFAALGVLMGALLIHHFAPGYWVHGTVLSYRDVIWAEVFRHLPEYLWIGAGSVYFRQSVAPGLPVEVITAHSAYLDYLLAYGVVGVLLLTMAGVVLARFVRTLALNGQAIWLYGSFSFLAMFGLFDRSHLDTLMLAAMLMIPSLLMAIWGVARQGALPGSCQPQLYPKDEKPPVNSHQVICIKWGTRYGPEYVNRLYAMVARNLAAPFRFICFTDDRRGIRPEVVCFDLPELGCPVPTNAPGKFRKLALWNTDLFGLSGNALFLDLDVVITGPLDDLFAYGNPDDVILARNWIKPLERLGQTSVFRFPIGRHGYMLDDFRADPEGLAGKYQFEQRYVTHCVRGGVRFFPSAWIRHFRLDCLGPWPLRYLRPARLPKQARIVMFPGKPDPADAILGRWSAQVEHEPPLQHLGRLLNGKHTGSAWRHLKRYLLPVPWVAEHWRE